MTSLTDFETITVVDFRLLYEQHATYWARLVCVCKYQRKWSARGKTNIKCSFRKKKFLKFIAISM